jgi:hypothetical protein
MCSLGWPQTHDLPASDFIVLGLQACITTPRSTRHCRSFHFLSYPKLLEMEPLPSCGENLYFPAIHQNVQHEEKYQTLKAFRK